MSHDLDRMRRLRLDLDILRANDFRKEWPTALAIVLQEGRRLCQTALEFSSAQQDCSNDLESALAQISEACATVGHAVEILGDHLGNNELPSLVAELQTGVTSLGKLLVRLESSASHLSAQAAKEAIRQEAQNNNCQELANQNRLLLQVYERQDSLHKDIAALQDEVRNKRLWRWNPFTRPRA